MVGKLALFVAPTLIANLLNITFPNFEIKAEHCCNRRGTDRHTDQAKYASGCVFLWNDADGGPVAVLVWVQSSAPLLLTSRARPPRHR